MANKFESARERLQAILSELEQACSNDETLSLELLHEMHSLMRFLHKAGFNVATVRHDKKLVVEIEPFTAATEYDWAA